MRDRYRFGLGRYEVATALLTIGLLVILAAYGKYRFGSVGQALAYVGGERLLVDEPVKSLGVVPPDREIRVEYSLTNLANHPTKVVGARMSCGCTRVSDLPLTIPPGGTRSLLVTIEPRESSRPQIQLGLFTDDPRHPVIGLEMRLRVDSTDPDRDG